MEDHTVTIPMGWRMITLGEVADVFDCSHSTPTWTTTGYFVVRNYNLSNGKIIRDDTGSYTDEKNYRERIRRATPEVGDIILSREAPIGALGMVEKKEDICLGQRVVLIKPKNIVDKFLLYQMLSPFVQNEFKIAEASGSVVSNFRIPQIKGLRLLYPSVQIQHAIAKVLSSLDDKIELLQTQNKTIENIAQTLFKHWFIDFEFPNENGLPYKSSGGKMIDSELGEIPYEWKIGNLGEVTDVRGGTTPSTEVAEYWNGNIHWTSPKDLSNIKDIYLLDTEKKITELGLTKISSGLLPKGTLLLSSRAPIGYLAITNMPVAINQGYIALLPGAAFSNFYMYLWLKTNMQTIIGASNGSTFLEISKGSFKLIPCIIPTKAILDNFQTVITPIFDKMLLNVSQIKTLSITRDAILPRLMKGELRVKDLGD